MSLLGAVAVPLLALVISPVTAAALLLPIFVVSDHLRSVVVSPRVRSPQSAILIGAGILGIGLGWATASIVTERWVGFDHRYHRRELLPQRLAAEASRSLSRGRADVPRGIFWGTLMGFSSFVSHSGGPPYQVYVLPQQLPKTVYAGTTTIVFAVINAVKLVPYWALGQLSMSNLKTSAWLMPVAIAGTFAGVRLVRVLPQRTYFAFVQRILFLVSLKLIWDAV